MRRLRTLVLYAAGAATETLSYYRGWPEHLASRDDLEVTALNLLRRGDRVRLAAAGRHDVLLVLHSVYSNEPYLRGPLVARARSAAPVRVFFVGNEYKLMPEKLELAERLEPALLVTQLQSPRAQELYRARVGCEVLYLPYTGLDARLFAPGPPLRERPLDVGYRAYDSPPYLGHQERRLLAGPVADAARAVGLDVDASLEPAERLAGERWAGFLRDCRVQLGSEAGGEYFELTDETRRAVNAFLDEHPDAPWERVHARFFASYAEPVSGRALSGRVVEAAGTKTAQLLLEGAHGGLFEPDVHYVPLRHDLSNLDESLEKLRDLAYLAELTERAHELAHAELTYDRLVSRLLGAVRPLVA